MVKPISIVYDHNDFVVINKPCDIQMHDPINGICHLLCAQMGIEHVYLVHRLDAATSGCLLLAKNKQTASALSTLFANKQIEKFYLAISDTKPKKKQGKIAGDMKKSRGGSYMLCQSESKQAKAITFFISEAYHDIGRLYYVKPITGKTHQIRVALKSIGSAILGDKRYKGSDADRLYLHSHMLNFTYNKNYYSISCLPETGEHFSHDKLAHIRDAKSIDWPKYKAPNEGFEERNHHSSNDSL
jgi:tRNA pseudouridine32 synthase/23S rRNA pseudouridine746 synthase